MTTRRVIILVLFMFLCTPYFTVESHFEDRLGSNTVPDPNVPG